MQRILTALLNTFQEITIPVVPNKIGAYYSIFHSNDFFGFYLDVLVIPEYPSDVVSHWGLIIGTERAILHNPSTTSQIDHQRIALFIAKAFAEQVRRKTFTFLEKIFVCVCSSGMEISFHFDGGLISGCKKLW